MKVWMATAHTPEDWLAAIIAGFHRHKIRPTVGWENEKGADLVVGWGWRKCRRYRDMGHHVLVMERGYVGERTAWLSLGFDGLNGRAIFPPADDGERWRLVTGGVELQPWRAGGDYALIMGQVASDEAVRGVDMAAWYSAAVASAGERGLPARFRPHPEDVRCERVVDVPGAVTTTTTTLRQDLAGAALVMTHNSNTGVDAALAGVPAITCDRGAMAWPVTAHGLEAAAVTPDRSAWCHRLAWCQWSQQEVAGGVAWEHLREMVPRLDEAPRFTAGASLAPAA